LPQVASRRDRLRRTIGDFFEDGSGTYSRLLRQWPATTPARQRAIGFLEEELGRLADAVDRLLDLAALAGQAQNLLARLGELGTDQPAAWHRLVEEPGLADRLLELDTPEQARQLVEHLTFLEEHLSLRGRELSEVSDRLLATLPLDTASHARLITLSLEARVEEMLVRNGRVVRSSVKESVATVNVTAALHTRHLGYGSTPRGGDFLNAPRLIREPLQRWELLRHAGERIQSEDD
jgi:hypothetical protein